ncbi:MAG: hypothetical protein ACKON8_03070 [Planctomycetota bacterium]
MFHRPLLTPAAIIFWLTTTGWLVVTKILPSLHPGLPPGQQALYASGTKIIPVAWSVLWNERPIGWALSTARLTDSRGLDVESRLHFDRLPLNEMLPGWAGLFLRQLARNQGPTTLDARGRLAIDSTGRLRAFASHVDFPGAQDGVALEGTVNDGEVAVTVKAGGLQYDAVKHLPDHVMIGDELSPQATMPGLYEGRRWTVPVYSPLRPGQSPIEILHADVGGETTLFWEDGLVRVHVVSYREDPTSGREPRCRLWVDLEGRVLKQEAALLGARMTFLRRTDDAAAWLAESGQQEAAVPAAILP